MAKCAPHIWDYENWLPIMQGAEPANYPAMTCRNCGRIYPIAGRPPYHLDSIAHSLASRIFSGDEYSEIYDSVREYFALHR